MSQDPANMGKGATHQDALNFLFRTREMSNMIVELTDICFDSCIYNFRTRKLDPKEKLCIFTCSDKFYRVASRVGKILDEQSLLEEEYYNIRK